MVFCTFRKRVPGGTFGRAPFPLSVHADVVWTTLGRLARVLVLPQGAASHIVIMLVSCRYTYYLLTRSFHSNNNVTCTWRCNLGAAATSRPVLAIISSVIITSSGCLLASHATVVVAIFLFKTQHDNIPFLPFIARLSSSNLVIADQSTCRCAIMKKAFSRRRAAAPDCLRASFR